MFCQYILEVWYERNYTNKAFYIHGHEIDTLSKKFSITTNEALLSQLDF